ncbi:MAG: fumarylacetoacetate hydrolase family protein, partial [Bacteroidia bacterium]
IELEMAYIIGKSTQLGKPISIENAEDHIFGKVIFNDWSARDIQAWEYVPLGPFLGKNFGSTISPWIVTMEALEPFRCESIKQEPAVLPYLQFTGNKNFDINLEVAIAPEGYEETVISESNFKYMYWNMAQQLAHHTVNGCNVNVGDLMASGTISGRDQNSYGSMIEISQGGKEPMQLKNGETRTFLEDGDTVTIRAFCEKDGKRVGFGECIGTITP